MTDTLIKFAVEHGDGSYAYAPSRYGSHTRVLAAATAEEHTVPADANGVYAQKVVFSSTADFWALPITEDEDNLVTNGDFALGTGWTLGTGWSIGSGTATSDASQTGDSDLEQDFAGGLVEGVSYDTSITVSGRTAGNVTVVIGGTEGTDRATNATHTETIIAGSTDTIALRADADFDGSVDDFTVTPIAVTPADGGVGPVLNPTTWNLGGKYKKLSLYSTAGGNINMQFFA